jgi:DNA polymerase I-like protein with 3'-5' exonuclease and polymerase domains
MKTPLLVDIETDGRIPQRGELLLIGWCLVGEPVSVIEVGRGPADDSGLREALADPERPVVTMTKYDARYLRLQGWEVTGPYHDIQVMAWVLNENQQLSLDAIAKRYCGIQMDKRLRRSQGAVYFKDDDGFEWPLVGFGPEAGSSWEQFVDYCRRDVVAEMEVYQTLLEKLRDTTWDEYWEGEEVPYTEALLDTECNGLPIDMERSDALRRELEPQVLDLRSSLHVQGSLPGGFNINSGDQLAAYLYYPVMELADSLDWGADLCAALKSCQAEEHEDCEPGWEYHDDGHRVGLPMDLHIADLLPSRFTVTSVGREQVHGVWTVKGRGLTPTEKTPSEKRWSTSTPVLKSNLAAAQDPWVQQLMEYRRYEKALTTYLRRYPELEVGGRIYGRFNQTGTKTGRLSSSEPNLQNQPAHGELGARMRDLFRGQLVVGDYSQLEPRLMAHFSEDPRLLAVYRNDADVYLDLAHAIFGPHVEKDDRERGIAKVLVLALGYGAGHKKVAQILTINGFPTDEFTADGYLREMQAYYNRFFAWREHTIRKVHARGYVETIGGRHRRLKRAFKDRKNWKAIGYGERQAVNAIIQGSAGDIVRRVMVNGADIFRYYDLTLLAQVHDELVWEVHPANVGNEALLRDLANTGERLHGFDLRCPLKFEPHFGESWYAAKEGAPLELPEDLEQEETLDYAEEAS